MARLFDNEVQIAVHGVSHFLRVQVFFRSFDVA